MSRSDGPFHDSPPDADALASRRATRHPSVSLRWRLTLLIIAVFAVIQVTVTVVRLLAVRKAIDGTFATQLDSHARRLAEDLRRAPLISDSPAFAGVLNRYLSDLSTDTFIETVGLSVDRVEQPPAASEWRPVASVGVAPDRIRMPVKDRLPLLMAADQDESVVLVTSSDPPVRLLARRFVAADDRTYVVVLRVIARAIDDEIAQAERAFIISTPIGILAAAIGAWYIAGVAVKPLNRLRQIVQRLRPESLGESINIPSTASEVTRLQDDLNAARKRLEEGYQAQERFIANVSHEIKTPIAVILTEAQTLRGHTGMPADVRAFITSAEDEMRRLGQLVESFLLLARVREGQGIFTVRKPYPINELVMESMEHCGRMAIEQDVTMLPRLIDPDAAEVTVNGDPALLRTVIDNLLRNALRFSPPGERVEADLHADENSVSVIVRDHGPGIPPEVLAHIFDRFSSVKSEQRLGRGSGLGLEIAKGIAEIHGGDITAVNHPDGGCVFTLTLPAVVRPLEMT